VYVSDSFEFSFINPNTRQPPYAEKATEGKARKPPYAEKASEGKARSPDH